MLFSSSQFIFFFLPMVLLLVYSMQHHFQHILKIKLLVILSLFFYSWWQPALAWLLPFSILVNYYLGTRIQTGQGKQKKLIFILGVAFNLCLLFFFKYTNFFITFINDISLSSLELLDIILPLAISFFTFQQIAYLYDCKKGLVKNIDVWRYALFVSFFPQLICGPIVHYKELVPQFDGRDFVKNTYENIACGIILFTIGLCKKVVIADNLAPYVEKIYSAATQGIISTLDAWYGTLLFTFQIYFDFSGYTDMALGLALFFGIKLPENFNSPYKAVNIYDLWKRWHITLTRFMRTHLFYPLSRNKSCSFSVNTALFITIVLGGLWHGANWTFIIWAVMHACLLLINHYWRKLNSKADLINMSVKPAIYASIFITFFVGMFTRAAFRAEDSGSMWGIYESMLGLGPVAATSVIEYQAGEFLLLLPLFSLIWFFPNSNELVRKYTGFMSELQNKLNGKKLPIRSPQRFALVLVAIFMFSVLSLNDTVEFIYYKF